MKKTILLFVILLSVLSCKSDYEKNLETMAEKTLLHYQNSAFKENKTLEVIEYTPVSYTVKNMHWVDSARLSYQYEKYIHFEKLAGITMEQMKNQKSLIQAHKILNVDKFILDAEIEDYNEFYDLWVAYGDSMNAILVEDSIIRDRIKKQDHPDLVYLYKYFFKATFSDKNGSSNVLDTLFMVFDHDFNFILE